MCSAYASRYTFRIDFTCVQWLGLKFPETAIYWNTARKAYEAYVLYNFLCYLLNFLQFEYDLAGELATYVRQPPPFCCCRPWPHGQ